MSSKPRRPWPFFLHSLFGLHLSLFFGFVCLTGTIATVRHEIEWLLLPKIRATATAAPAGWGAQWYVDPGTGRATGHSNGVTFHALMRGLHYYLLAPTDIPFYAVTSLGVAMLLSLVTGFIVYKKFWRGFFKWPRFHREPRVWWGDLHRLVGLWSLWFVLTIGVTSVWYLLEWDLLHLESPEPHLERTLTLAEWPTPDGATFDRWVALAQARMPGLRVTAIYLPWEPTGAVTVQGQWCAWLVRSRTNAVFIDPRDDRVIGVRDAQAIGLGERWVHTADPLHFGDFAGLATKLIWVVFGLALTFMALSGALVFAKRTAKAARRLPARAVQLTTQAA